MQEAPRRIAQRWLQAKEFDELAHYGLDKLVRGETTTLYHGTVASFRKFDMSKGRDELVNRFYGRGIFLTPSKRVASLYANANRNIGLDPSIIKDLSQVNRTAGAFLAELVKKGDDAWEDEGPGGIMWAKYWADQPEGLDIGNDVGDIAAYVVGSKVKPVGSDSPGIFSQSTGAPDWLYDQIERLGIDADKYKPKVYTVQVRVKNPLVTTKKSEAKKARSKGHDCVILHSTSGLVRDVPEVAVFDVNAVRVVSVEVD